MEALGGELLLVAWECGAAQDEQRRALAMIALALPDRDESELAELPLAEINMLLLELHGLSFGPLVEVFATCSACEAPFEFSVPVSELSASQRDALTNGPLEWSEQGMEYRLRPVTTSDLLAALALVDGGDAQEELLSRCLETPADGRTTRPSRLLEQFEQLNEGAELTLTSVCPRCGSIETLDLDPARFVWTEVRREASRLLDEVHALAAAYSWSEGEIAAMSPPRRAAYLDRIGA